MVARSIGGQVLAPKVCQPRLVESKWGQIFGKSGPVESSWGSKSGRDSLIDQVKGGYCPKQCQVNAEAV